MTVDTSGGSNQGMQQSVHGAAVSFTQYETTPLHEITRRLQSMAPGSPLLAHRAERECQCASGGVCRFPRGRLYGALNAACRCCCPATECTN